MGNGITVKELFQGLNVEIKGNQDLEITGICSHSKFVAPGNLFIAKKGEVLMPRSLFQRRCFQEHALF